LDGQEDLTSLSPSSINQKTATTISWGRKQSAKQGAKPSAKPSAKQRRAPRLALPFRKMIQEGKGLLILPNTKDMTRFKKGV